MASRRFGRYSSLQAIARTYSENCLNWIHSMEWIVAAERLTSTLFSPLTVWAQYILTLTDVVNTYLRFLPVRNRLCYITELEELEDSTLLGDADNDVDDEVRPDAVGGQSGAESAATAAADDDELGAAVADTPHVDAVLRLFKQREHTNDDAPGEQWPSTSSTGDSSPSHRAGAFEANARQGSRRQAAARSVQAAAAPAAHASERQRRRRSHLRQAENAGAGDLVQGAPRPHHREAAPSQVCDHRFLLPVRVQYEGHSNILFIVFVVCTIQVYI